MNRLRSLSPLVPIAIASVLIALTSIVIAAIIVIASERPSRAAPTPVNRCNGFPCDANSYPIFSLEANQEFDFSNSAGVGNCNTNSANPAGFFPTNAAIGAPFTLAAIVVPGQAQTGTLSLYDSLNCSGTPFWGTTGGSPAVLMGALTWNPIYYGVTTGISWIWWTNGPQGRVFAEWY